MDRDTYRQTLERLRDASDAYYRGVESGMDDAEYDALHAAAAAAERANPSWGAGEGVSSRVGHTVGGRGVRKHRTPMLSLDNVFDRTALTSWLDSLGGAEVMVEPKLDGLAISATYQGGKLVQVVTRGDGITGEDVTGAPVHIEGLPDMLTEPVHLEVRGEVCMTVSDLALENLHREGAGEKLLANPRNAAAGAMLALPGRRAVQVSFWAYDCPDLPGDHASALQRLRKLGIRVSTDLWTPDAGEGAADAVERLGRERAGLPAGIDGAVIKAVSVTERDRLGRTSRAPRWAVAYKYPAELRRTRLRAIDLQVGRGGSITPVGRLDTVHVGGADVSSVTLHNPGDILRKDIRVGDVVWVRRAGDVIPEIVGPDLTVRPDEAASWTPPTCCPDCGGPVDTGGARLRCAVRCGIVPALTYAAGRDALDIDGAGAEMVEAAHAAGILSDVPSLYDLAERTAELSELEVNGRRFGAARAQRVARAAARAKKLPLERHLTALGIPGVGRRVAGNLAARLTSVDALVSADAGTLAEVEGIGTVRAHWIRQDLEDRAAEVGRMLERIDPPASPPRSGGTLAGKTFAVTGRLTLRSRDDLVQEIERRGGKVVGSVTARTGFLVRGEGGGSKSRDAERHGVTILTEEQFERMLNGTGDRV